MPLYEYKVRDGNGDVHHVEELRSVSSRDDPVWVDDVPYPVVELDEHSPGNALSVLPRASAFRCVSFAHTNMPAHGFIKAMPKRPGMSGCSYPGRSWPAERGNSIIPT